MKIIVILILCSFTFNQSSKIGTDINYPGETESLPLTKWDDNFGEGYAWLASIGYSRIKYNTNDFDEVTKPDKTIQNLLLYKKLIIQDGWIPLVTRKIVVKEKNHTSFAYTILRHDSKKKLVISFSGSTIQAQLDDELESIKRSTSIYRSKQGTNDEFIEIYEYFALVYEKTKEQFYPDLKRALETIPNDELNNYQVIYTGHSLGGGMATLFLFDSIKTKQIHYNNNPENQTKTKEITSPVVVSFASPRVGNVYFASEFYQIVPNQFRIVNRDDFLVMAPFCYHLDSKHCINEFNSFDIDLDYSNSKVKIPINSFHLFPAWHTKGYYLIKDITTKVSTYVDKSEFFSKIRKNTDKKYFLESDKAKKIILNEYLFQPEKSDDYDKNKLKEIYPDAVRSKKKKIVNFTPHRFYYGIRIPTLNLVQGEDIPDMLRINNIDINEISTFDWVVSVAASRKYSRDLIG